MVFVVLSGSLRAQGASSFVDWSPAVTGAHTGYGNWTGFGTVNYSVDFYHNSNGIVPAAGGVPANVSPVSSPSAGMGDLAPSGVVSPTEMRGLTAYPGRINSGVTSGIGYDMTFTFAGSGGESVFPSASPEFIPLFYLVDIDYGSLKISASLGGSPLDTSDWFHASFQTSSIGSGLASTWNTGTSTLVSGNVGSETWAYEFRPKAQFDTLVFSYTGGTYNDGVTFVFGGVEPIPEPSGILLGVLGALPLVVRRRRPGAGASPSRMVV
jgi:hypothetical protein